MKERIIKKLKNLSLHIKLSLTVFVAVIILTAMSIGCISMTINSGNALIYKALAGSLSYTSSDISSKISNIEAMTNMIITNSDIRKNLIILLDEDYEIKKKNARNNLERLLTDYQQTYKNNNIAYISLHSNDVHITSYEPGFSATPEHIHTSIIADTKSNSGYPIWDTSYCNKYGLFLGREARQVKHLSFRTLGTVVVSIDLKNLIASSTQSIALSDNIRYILMDSDGKVFYRPDEFTLKQATELSREVESDYQIININDTAYFSVKGNLSANSWQYICLFPYDEMAKAIHTTEGIVFVLIIITLILVILMTGRLVSFTLKDVFVLVQKMNDFSGGDALSFEADFSYQDRSDEIGILHNRFDSMVLQTQDLIRQNYVSEILTKEAQLKALENQINPHFLYNTLESVNWRAKAIGETDISAMVESLGNLLRETISVKEKMNSLGHELQIVSNYMAIQKIRYGERLEYYENVPEELLSLQLPHLTIQPLVENAIYYALEEVIGPCRIEVSAHRETDRFIVSVKNNGSQFEDHALEKMLDGTSPAHGFGVGILNIQKRIQIIYGTQYGLELCNEPDDIAVVNIYLPGGQHDKTSDC